MAIKAYYGEEIYFDGENNYLFHFNRAVGCVGQTTHTTTGAQKKVFF